MKIIPINTKSKRYKIYIGKNIISNFNKIAQKENIVFEKCLIVVDKKIPKKFVSSLKKNVRANKKIVFYFNASEKNKNLNPINSILKILFINKFTRNDAIICLGGGITGDVSGFVSSIYKRGLKFINIPSTLLSQVDSSIGGKTGVNNKFGKNLIGSFYQPDLVLSDIYLLKSLPEREIICGYAEIFKHSLLKNKKFFLFLDKNLRNILNLKTKFIERAILESCRIKKEIVQKDEKEKNLRKSLNLGHTFGHAYEAALKYSKLLNHGEAVLYGIFSAVKLSKHLRILNKKDYELILAHLSKLRFDNLNKFFNVKNVNQIVNFMLADKKNTSKKINFITLNSIGSVNIKKQLSASKVENFIKSHLLK